MHMVADQGCLVSVRMGVLVFGSTAMVQLQALAPLWTGILTGAQLTLSRHHRVGTWHGGVLGVHESLWVRDRFW